MYPRRTSFCVKGFLFFVFFYVYYYVVFLKKYLDVEIDEEPVSREKLLELGRRVIDGSVVSGTVR